MPRAIRHARHDESECGEIVYLRTAVEYGDDGIKGLRHFVPIEQGNWLHDGTANHALSRVYDAGTSRIMDRITASAGGAITSKMRKRLLLPYDFGQFFSFSLSLIVRGNAGTLPTSFKLTLLNAAAADATINGLSIKPTVGNTFELKTTMPGTVYVRGVFLTLEFELVTANNGEWGEIGDLFLAYQSGRGNS